MGRAVCDSSAGARRVIEAAGEVAGRDIRRLCFEGPLEELTRTDNLQVALTAVNIAHFVALEEQGVTPSVAAGHSLGEYAALVAAGVLSAEDALALVRLRGELMQREAERHPGTMAAVIGLSLEQVEGLCAQAGEGVVEGVVVANHNSPVQAVISGGAEAVARAVALAKGAGGKALPLAVSGAWHSPLIAGARAELRAAIEAADFRPARCPVVCNVDGAAETDTARLKNNLASQLCSPVRWVDSQRRLAQMADCFIEVGPRKVLLGLLKKTLPEAAAASAEEPDGLRDLLERIK
jgi:[acyl-carrier-protein] S-malonyltransferase